MKTCDAGDCNEVVTSIRSDARWHSDACRKRTERQIAALDGIAPGKVSAFWKGLAAVRRPRKADKARTGGW